MCLEGECLLPHDSRLASGNVTTESLCYLGGQHDTFLFVQGEL